MKKSITVLAAVVAISACGCNSQAPVSGPEAAKPTSSVTSLAPDAAAAAQSQMQSDAAIRAAHQPAH